VDMVAIHAAAAVFGQECWVDVDDVVWEGVEDVLRYEPEEACEDDPVDVFLLQVVEDVGGAVEVGAVEVVCFYSEVLCALGDVGIAFIVYDTRDFDVGAAGEVFADLLCVGAVA